MPLNKETKPNLKIISHNHKASTILILILIIKILIQVIISI